MVDRSVSVPVSIPCVKASPFVRLSCVAFFELSPISLAWLGERVVRPVPPTASSSGRPRGIQLTARYGAGFGANPGQAEGARERRIPGQRCQTRRHRWRTSVPCWNCSMPRRLPPALLGKRRVGRQNLSAPQKSQSGVEKNTDRTNPGDMSSSDDAEPVAFDDTTVEIVSAYVAHQQIPAFDLSRNGQHRGGRIENARAPDGGRPCLISPNPSFPSAVQSRQTPRVCSGPQLRDTALPIHAAAGSGASCAALTAAGVW